MINGSADTFVENVMIMGFGNCLLSPNGIRASFRRVRGDCTNFFAMTKCDDTCFIDRLEAYPFLAAGQTPQVQSSAVSSVANSGGLINVTLLAAPSYPIKTGYQVKIKGVDGVPANGRWTATRIDDTNFTLQGSAFSGRYRSGGTVYIDSITRTGEAFLIKDVAHMTGLVSFGFDVGVHFAATPAGASCIGCFIDGASAGTEAGADNRPVGVLIDSAAVQTGFVGGTILIANAVQMNSTGNTFIFANNTVGLRAGESADASISGAGIRALAGTVISTGNAFIGSQATGSAFYLTNSAFLRSANDFVDGGRVITYQSPGATCARYFTYGKAAC